MIFHRKSFSRLALATLLGIALTGTLYAVPAHAQGKMMDDKKMMGDADSDWMDMMMDPSPMGYPHAAPGALHLFHYSDYTKDDMMPGSAEDMRMENEKKMKGKMMSDKTMMSDEDQEMMDMMMDPSPMGYPHAAPGALHLFHYSDYTKDDMMPGSAEDMRMENEKKMKDKMASHSHMGDRAMMSDEDQEMTDMMMDPSPMGYPHAAPGALHLFHYSDYTKDDMMPGSTEDMRMEKQKKMDDQKKMHKMSKPNMN